MVKEKLNTVLASLQIFAQNTYVMHWQIKGEKFFEFHGVSGTLYDELGGTIDVIAERIRALDCMPITTFSEYLKMSTISELANGEDWNADVNSIVTSLNNILSQFKSAIVDAQAESDEGSVNMLGGLIECYEKKLWMFKSYLPQTNVSARTKTMSIADSLAM